MIGLQKFTKVTFVSDVLMLPEHGVYSQVDLRL